MAAADVLPLPTAAQPSWTSLIMGAQEAPASVAATAEQPEPFTARKHIDYTPPAKIHTMRELGLPEDRGISPVAVSEPFPLFTRDAVMRMRDEVFSDRVLANCRYSSNLAHCQLRGFASRYAPFVYDAWKSPEVLAIVSGIAGIDLVTEMDFEIAHINVSVKSEQESADEAREYHSAAAQRERATWATDYDDAPIVGWHTDSYPFVCVTMLSDCAAMIGGETMLRTGNPASPVMRVRSPQMGCAVVLQGRYIEHQALRAVGAAERITMVTSFRPRSPSVRDDTVLTTVRSISDLGELYTQFCEYRLEILEERIRALLRDMRVAGAAGRRVATARLKAFLAEQERFLAHMNREVVDEDMVVKGFTDDSHLLSNREDEGDLKSVKRARGDS